MAEAMELNLTLPISEDNQVDNPILQKTTLNGKGQKPEKGNNKYNIEQYYKNDSLGSDVLKQKYLAPWEEHPYQLWERQAKALASVEKNDKLKKESIIATKATCQAAGHLGKIPIFFIFFNVSYAGDWNVLFPLVVAVYFGTKIGKLMLGKIPEALFQNLFKAVLTLIAVRLIIIQIW